MTTTHPAPHRAGTRWGATGDVLAELRRRPGTTRAGAARRLGMGSGAATEVCARLRELHLLSEQPAPPAGRGRPTTTLHPHPAGPLAVVVDVQHEDVTLAVVDVAGALHDRVAVRPRARSPHQVLAVVSSLLDDVAGRHGRRLRSVTVSVAATVADGHVVQASTLGWDGVDVTGVLPPALADRPLLVVNDATAAGLAEARSPDARRARAVLYLTVAVGVGGALVVDGHPQTGALGAAGEMGHLPLGDRALVCPCGARGCWDLEVDGRAMARHRGHAPPADPHSYAEATLAAASDPTSPDHGCRRAAQRCASALAGGTAGLVNALDVDRVVLGGLAPALRRAAPQAFADALEDGLMRWRRPRPPPVLDAVHGRDASLLGAAESALDHLLSEPGLSAWAALHDGDHR